jgi:hypothetical protein
MQNECPVVFVVDTSGSMCVTREVKGNFQLKGAPVSIGNDFSSEVISRTYHIMMNS